MRQGLQKTLRLSLLLNACLLVLCMLRYTSTPPAPPIEMTGYESKDATWAGTYIGSRELAANVVASSARDTLPNAQKLTSIPDVKSSTAPNDLLAEEVAADMFSSTTDRTAGISPQCALYKLRKCRNVDPQYRVEMHGTRFWVMYNLVMGTRNFACDESVTYTTHGDFTYLDNLGPLVNRWRAPVSFGLYAPGDDFVISLRSIAYLTQCGDPQIAELVTFHVIFDVDKVPPEATKARTILSELHKCDEPPPWLGKVSYRKAKKLTYPVNIARNVARRTVMTHFVFPSDVELYPSTELAVQFLQMIERNEPALCKPQPKVYVLSIFEVGADMHAPYYKNELTAMLKNGTAIPFHQKMCAMCHKIPKAKEWTFTNQTDQMAIFTSAKRHKPYAKWEPIYICTNEEPTYDERLTWEGKMDKMGQGYAMCLLDYDFLILNNAFLVHKPGIKTHKPDKWRDALVSKQRRFIINAARAELDRIYGTNDQCKLQ